MEEARDSLGGIACGRNGDEIPMLIGDQQLMRGPFRKMGADGEKKANAVQFEFAKMRIALCRIDVKETALRADPDRGRLVDEEIEQLEIVEPLQPPELPEFASVVAKEAVLGCRP